MAGADLPWWRRGAVYQVYPRSFADSDGDGVGDLGGLRRRLDHIASLGAEALWLSPVFPSPMADFGYDVSDYCDIDPVFGSLADFDRLVSDAHARGLRVVLDWVANHTSEEHPWFRESRSSRTNPRRDWYVWADPRPDGGPPNNWASAFRAVGPAWTLDEVTGQYYLHSFAPQQPDLNWDNPEVEAAMHQTVRFWLDRGVDGLRLDAIIKVAKDPQLRDTPAAAVPHHEDWETIHDRLARLRQVVDEYPDRMLVGELWARDLPRFVSFLTGTGMHLAHNFEFVELPWDAGRYREFIDRFEAQTDEVPDLWPCWFLENHDLPRIASRLDDDGLGEARARAVLLMVYTLRGTPFVYQGQELGLPDAEIPADRVVDLDGRDPERAPIPWERPSECGAGAGFTTGTPWLPLVERAEDLCVAAQKDDPASTLHLTRRIARLREGSAALREGRQRTVDAGAQLLAWVREVDGERVLVVVNFAAEPLTPVLPPDLRGSAQLVLRTAPGRSPGELSEPAEVSLRNLRLAAGEGVALRLAP
ncbi:alpha-amylase family glycosyl hydrolase [Knoellia sp. 3-2P3]|uniref:alpha-amylase family glycosyl hydrolase n=1 Tax=unclassified Knoellia TaxID=2618719 RepID=UPI0023D9E39A|nr:alpha-amylase family glycosyl hydrolase [Knoellia sp. 3-2P3]MDF2092339.1 alpha-amylase family glycosyl hydrolase [Knoellia sp. 3-2P3]